MIGNCPRDRSWLYMCQASLLALGCAILPGNAAAEPQISNLSLRGLQIGTATTLTIDGSDLLPDPRVVLPVGIAKQSTKPGATANRVQMEISLSAAARPGLYHLRVANSKGISNAALVGVDDLAQIPFAPRIASLPAALHGNLAYGATLQTSFTGKKGERIVVDLEARRLGAALDPVVELYDPRRVQLSYSQGHPGLNGDARLETILPADGEYTIDLHDVLYQGGNPNFFRLKIGTLSYADLVFPLGWQRDQSMAFDFIGSSIPHGKLDLHGVLGDIPAPLPSSSGVVGPAPRIIVGEFPEVIEAAPAGNKLQEVAVPAVINGRIGKPGEEDRYRLLVKPGMTLRFDVMANRAGSPLDGVLSIRNEAGAELAMSDDRPDTIDPGLDFTVPAGVNALVVALKDLEGRGGVNFVYRLSVTPADRPDFGLTLFEDRHSVPQGAVAVARVRANRMGYNGPIKLSIPGLPKGVNISPQEIPADATDALFSLVSAPGLSPAHLLTKLVGENTDPKLAIRREAMLPETPVTRNQPWLRSELAVAVAEAGPIRLAWDSAESSLALGSTFTANVRVERARDAGGQIRLSLLTSQVVPRTPDGKQEDRNRALRFQGMSAVPAGQAAASASILVPPDLPAISYDLAIKGELLDASGSMVLATAVTPARRLTTAQPFTLQLAGAAAVKARSGAGPTGKLTGKLLRKGGFNKPVTITLSGLPAGLPAPMVTVPGDRSEFELPVAFPYQSKLGALQNVKVVATSSVSAQSVLRSNEIPVAVEVVKGDPLPPSPPVTPNQPRLIFEDQPQFAANLLEGAGTAVLDSTDKYSGKSSIKVTPDQRFNERLPGLNIRIRQNPGAGEYRFLRFAWKKKGGATICLQLNHDGNWGPTAGATGKFRYHAGAGPEPYGASLRVGEKLPADWVVVTRDLYADFGEFTWTGIALSPVDGEYALFDHIYLGKTTRDFESVKPKPADKPK